MTQLRVAGFFMISCRIKLLPFLHHSFTKLQM